MNKTKAEQIEQLAKAIVEFRNSGADPDQFAIALYSGVAAA